MNLAHLSNNLPKEAFILFESAKSLNSNIKQLLIQLSNCFNTRKVFYNSQLIKIRDNANISIRQAIQVSLLLSRYMISNYI